MMIKVERYFGSTPTFIGVLVAEGLSKYAKTHPEENLQDLTTSEGELECRLIVAGREIPFEAGLKCIEEQLEVMVETRAVELLKERASKITETLSKLDEEVKELFPKAARENDW